MSRDTLICRNVKKLSRCQKENQFITHVHIHTRCTRYCLSDTGVNTKPVHNRSCWLCISTKRLTPQICCREQFQATPIWQWHVMSLSYVWLQKRQLWLKKKARDEIEMSQGCCFFAAHCVVMQNFTLCVQIHGLRSPPLARRWMNTWRGAGGRLHCPSRPVSWCY